MESKAGFFPGINWDDRIPDLEEGTLALQGEMPRESVEASTGHGNWNVGRQRLQPGK